MLIEFLFIALIVLVFLAGGVLIVRAFRFPEEYYKNREKREEIIMKQMKQHEKNKQK
ncbi:MAG: hypothetical protein ACQEQ4_08215 [Fibrobacterota bacterium]